MPGEEGITNLGCVPQGMTFAEATAAARPRRKYRINPYDGGRRLTICDTLRMTWRELDKLPQGPEVEQIRDYLAAAFDYAKRMNARLQELKARYPDG